MRAVSAVVGVALTLLVLADLVNAMLVPRGHPSPITRVTNAGLFRCYRIAIRSSGTFVRQDRILASAAPTAVLVQLVAFVALLILTMAFVIYGLSSLTPVKALYQSAATLTTLGIVAPVTDASAIASFAAALLGLVTVAVFIGYLMGLYSAYTTRESLVARWSLVAGEPAWAPAVFARAHMLGIPAARLLDAERWTTWTCDLRTQITVSPILAWFRSPSPLCHWSTTLLSVLDTATLRLACGVSDTCAADISLVAEGAIAARVIAGNHGEENLRVQDAIIAALATRNPSVGGLSDTQWQPCAAVLRAYGLLDDANEHQVRSRFDSVSSLYRPELTALAKTFHAVPAPWSGERSPDTPTLAPWVPTLDARGMAP